jgi:hypothetical protein
MLDTSMTVDIFAKSFEQIRQYLPDYKAQHIKRQAFLFDYLFRTMQQLKHFAVNSLPLLTFNFLHTQTATFEMQPNNNHGLRYKGLSEAGLLPRNTLS